MSQKVLTPAQAQLELHLLNAEADAMSSSDFYAWLKERGLADEVAIRLKAVAEITAEDGNRVVNLGKMILIKIMEFVKAQPHLAIGVAIGAALGFLANTFPLIGTFISPIITLLGVSIGAVAGHRLDKNTASTRDNSGLIAIAQEVIEIAAAFFKLFVEILVVTLDAKHLRGM